jgi:hypothetical protein
MSLDSIEIAVADVDEFWYGKPPYLVSILLSTFPSVPVHHGLHHDDQRLTLRLGSLSSWCNTELEEILALPGAISLDTLDNTLRMVISLFSSSHG